MKPIYVGLFNTVNQGNNKRFITHILNQENSYLNIPTSEYDDNKLNEVISNSEAIQATLLNKETNSNEHVEIIFKEFDLNLFYESINKVVTVIFSITDELSYEPFDCSDIAKKEIVGLIENVLMKYQYQDPIDLIYLIADIFKNALTNHKLKNGNKRMASMLLITLLKLFGFNLRNSFEVNQIDYWQIFEDKIIEFIEKYHYVSVSSNFIEDNDALLKEIYEWIYNSIQIY